ncbi:rhodanese-like domain-containing protein [Enterovirga aerilata]|uniref:Rhodanese-like domain-containing protein n=1 Tax=Enterovirga aerilata TaxID=2730920 RepID=A0A849I2M6_9HYPH|nr:rhodanese-like domain-containing protein [Enterovirga sp. DB1703]NNM71884.1 rhodanese-like domain-containing protein [Enterovirga sp. DB1703]
MSGEIRDVALDEVVAGLREGTITLVDVREPHEFAAGHIPGSVSMPLSRFDVRSLPKEGRVVFSCAAGVRSKAAIGHCRAAGLPWSEHFPGGFKDWAASGMPIAAGDS